ncbi:MAG: hypothetical protein PWP22_1043 [Thermoanaerobacter sp.]|nr:hypothetical protein [Thermoanaerobacter sp.]
MECLFDSWDKRAIGGVAVLKKVLMISSYPTEGCGVSKYSERLIKGLTEHNLNIYSERIYAHGNHLSSAVAWIKMLNTIRKLKPDILHIQYTPTITGVFLPLFLIILNMLRKSKKISVTKVVLTAHEKPTAYFEHTKTKWTKFLFWTYEKLVYTLSDVILVHTIEHKKEIYKFYKIEDKCKIIEYPLQIENVPSSSSGITPAEDINRGMFTVTYFGIIRPSRGVDTLIKAFKIASSYDTNLRLIITGKIPEKFKKYYSYLQKLVSDLNLKDKVLFRGFVPEKEISHLFESSDVIVLPYRKSTQSEVLHQAITYKRPVIVTNIGGIGEIVKRFKIGEICEIDDIECFVSKILLLSGNRKLISKYKFNTTHATETKSLKKTSEMYIKKIYRCS